MRTGGLEPDSVKRQGPNRCALLTLAVAILTGASLLAMRVAQQPLGFASCFAARPLRAGDAAPGFTLESLSGGTVRLSDLRGRVVVLNLWATWCGRCRDELRVLMALEAEVEHESVVILTVNRAEPPELIRDYLRPEGIDLPVLLSTREMLLAYGDDGSLPDTWVIDPSGTVRLHLSGWGGTSGRTLRSAVRKWLPSQVGTEPNSEAARLGDPGPG